MAIGCEQSQARQDHSPHGAGSDSRALSGFRSDVGFTGAHNQTKESIKSTQRASPSKFDQ
jgi:hypothetical protein